MHDIVLVPSYSMHHHGYKVYTIYSHVQRSHFYFIVTFLMEGLFIIDYCLFLVNPINTFCSNQI